MSAAPTKIKTTSANKPAKKAAKTLVAKVALPVDPKGASKKLLAPPRVDSHASPATQATANAVIAKPDAPKKVAKPVKPVQPTKPAVAAKPKTRDKLVRDSFTMPQVDFNLITTLKDRALGFKRPTKKSELLSAGLQVLDGLSPDALKAALARVAPLFAQPCTNALSAPNSGGC